MDTDHIKPDDIAPPIDIRLIPAAGLTALVCLIVPSMPVDWAQYVPLILMLAGSLAIVPIRSLHRRYKLRQSVLILAIACWLATPAACLSYQQSMAAELSGWNDFVDDLGTSEISVRLVTDPVAREGPFGTSWFVTAEVASYGKEATPTPHPAKIVISGDEAWSQLNAEEDACFFGRVTENEPTVFVRSINTPELGSCTDGPTDPTSTGRDTLRSALRTQAAETIGDAPELLPGLILGDRSQQTQAVDEAMKISGLSHLSAVSGAHTSLIASAATIVLRSIRLPRPVVIAAFLGTLLLFIQIVGTQPSVLRAALMGAIGAWAMFFGRGSQALPILALTTIVLLSLSPALIHDVGFQLSVIATAGIVVGAQPLERWLRPFFDKFLSDFWAGLFSSSLAISTAAQIACQPLLITFIDYVSVYSVIANLLATPLLPLITVPGIVAAALTLAAPALSQVILHIIAVPTAAIGWIATTTTQLPGATMPWPEGIAGSLLIILHWSATGILTLKLLRRQRRKQPPVRLKTTQPAWQRLIEHLKQHTNLVTTIQYCTVVVAVVAHLAVFWPTRPQGISPDWDLVGCDVGQGDMFLVRTGPVSAMVLDTGQDPQLAQQCLQAAGISHIDALVITHLHADHVGGVKGVLDTTDPEQIYFSTSTDPTYETTSTDLPARAQQIKEPKVHIIDHAKEDDDHPVQLRWSILSANHQSSNENNASAVVFIEIYRHGGVATALFTGDLEEDETANLLADEHLPDNVDILKLPHHGARNGGIPLIEHTSPELALIGVGADNSYGHPHDEILHALGPRTEIKRTDLHGSFSVTLHHSPAYVAAPR